MRYFSPTSATRARFPLWHPNFSRRPFYAISLNFSRRLPQLFADFSRFSQAFPIFFFADFRAILIIFANFRSSKEARGDGVVMDFGTSFGRKTCGRGTFLAAPKTNDRSVPKPYLPFGSFMFPQKVQLDEGFFNTRWEVFQKPLGQGQWCQGVFLDKGVKYFYLTGVSSISPLHVHTLFIISPKYEQIMNKLILAVSCANCITSKCTKIDLKTSAKNAQTPLISGYSA